jgi:aryl-alcohol dehydrogenase-like predicted oxidoreductase
MTAPQPTDSRATYGAQLPRRRLGRSGLIVPALALGGAGFGGVFGGAEEEAAIETVRYALAQRINYFDTSPYYQQSERRLGLALEGIKREDIVLSTKTGTHPERFQDYSWDATMWSVENSLKLLGTDYIDLLLVHDPHDMAPVFAPHGALDALESLRGQGVIKAIGLGQREHEFHRRAIESGRFDVILTFYDYNPVRTTAQPLLELAARHNTGVLNGAVLLFGLLAGNPDTPATTLRFPEREHQAARRLYQWCGARDIPIQAVALQFSLRQPAIHCTLTGAKTPQELEENLRAATLPLPDLIWREIAELGLTEGQE